MLAENLGYIYVDTGALYRAIGLYVLQHSAGTKDANAVAALLPDVKLELSYSSLDNAFFSTGLMFRKR